MHGVTEDNVYVDLNWGFDHLKNGAQEWVEVEVRC